MPESSFTPAEIRALTERQNREQIEQVTTPAMEKFMCRFWDVTYDPDGKHWADFRTIRSELETMRLDRRKRQERAGTVLLEFLKVVIAFALGILATNFSSIVAFFWKKAMKLPTVRGAIKYCLIAGIGYLTSVGWTAYRASGPSVTIQTIEEADGVVSGDTGIDLIVRAVRTRFCPSVTSRFVWRWVERDGEQIKQYKTVLGPPIPPTPEPGAEHYMLTLDLPANLPKGQWYYQSVSVFDCAWVPGLDNSTIRRSPSVPIEVLAR